MAGRFLLRIEDIDTARCRPELVAACLDDLAWLGLEWEEPVLRQSQHFARYRAVAADLESRGLAYPCFCTRGDIARAAGDEAMRDPDGAPFYPGTCRHLSAEERARRIAAGEPYAVRLDVAAALTQTRMLGWREARDAGLASYTLQVADPEDWGDVVLVRKDCPTSYHLSVVLDDAMQGVTHVLRGTDLFAATAIHRLLQALLRLPAPYYWHHPLIKDGDGRKLAKSAASKPLRELRADGIGPAEIRAQLGFS